MNDEQRKLIANLNAKHFTEFGVAPDGRLRFQWMRTDEMPMEFFRNHTEKFNASAGLWIANAAYKRRTFAELYGQGLCWTIAYLEPPIRQEDWVAVNGLDFPWPSNGFYRPLDCIALHIDILPDEDISMRAAFNIRTEMEILGRGLEAAYKADLSRSQAATAAREKALEDQIDDMISDAVPAFHNNPGGKGHVSLPS